ncbi:MAG: hypothetical protein CYPHOPRED_004815 [Cyphobasidiales sp. Tagirdzhanova-0007]|nr:MAG: hypothetical protein CYPHOPRED_004815 [Cyphobasidiales sp. Tagirdzhanova-0007]
MANTELIGATQIVSIMSHGSTRQGLIRRKLSMTSADAQLFGQFRFSHVAVGRHADDYEGTASPGLVNRLKGAKWMGMAEMMKTTAISCTLAALASLSSVLAVVPIHCDYVKESITYVANGAPEITYNGNWKFLSNQGAQDLSGVEAYALDPTANYALAAPIDYGNFSIHCGRAADRGYFDVYVNEIQIGTGDAYNASCISNCTSVEVFSADFTKLNITKGANITVVNHPRSATITKIDLNFCRFTPKNCAGSD